ncbi:hypothetical protein [Larkinella terrae]|uniref:Tetratricopeptide repeat protein n=1 Tax=Larkinella terrae TaxID=2025311 RepID=A0A7K0EFT5_9BACT|nr:hypothetical protein [Larkinella terrae]MRS60316.1 hypothetical protein [Larkinella terrae]
MASDKETRDILAYLNDTLPSNRRAAFEARLQSDPALQKRVASFQKVETSLAHLATLEQLRQSKKERVLVEQAWISKRLIYQIAASIVLVLAGWGAYRLSLNSNQDLYDDFYQPDLGTRGEAACPEAIDAVIELRRNKEYEQALAALEKVPNQSLACVSYQRGLIQLELSEPEKAVASFQEAMKSDIPTIRQQSEWHLCLAYLLTDDREQLKPLLRKIAAEPNHTSRQAAQRLLARLDS